MNLSKKKYQKIDKLEARKQLSDEEFRKLEEQLEETERINEEIQASQKIQSIYSNEVRKLPNKFQFVRNFRKSFTDTPSEYERILNEFKDLEDWALPFPLLILKASVNNFSEKSSFEGKNQKEIRSTKKLSFLRKTKRNLRYGLKHHSRTTKVDFTPLGTYGLNGLSKPFESEFKQGIFSYGSANTCQIYRNPIVQAFFEFALNYSHIKHIELSFDEAKRIFLRACNSSLGQKLDTELENQSFTEYLSFLYQERGVFDSTDLPTYKVGRPNRSKVEIEQMIQLHKQGKSNREISRILNPHFSEKSAKVTKDGARIGRALRRKGFYTKKARS